MSINWDKYAKDCAHLRACRLMCKRSKSQNSKSLTRYCNEDCTAYQKLTHVDAVEYSQAKEKCHRSGELVEYGYGEWEAGEMAASELYVFDAYTLEDNEGDPSDPIGECHE